MKGVQERQEPIPVFCKAVNTELTGTGMCAMDIVTSDCHLLLLEDICIDFEGVGQIKVT